VHALLPVRVALVDIGLRQAVKGGEDRLRLEVESARCALMAWASASI
jgi:hypothetical protein